MRIVFVNKLRILVVNKLTEFRRFSSQDCTPVLAVTLADSRLEVQIE